MLAAKKFVQPLEQTLAFSVHVPDAIAVTVAPLIEQTEALPALTAIVEAPAAKGLTVTVTVCD